MALLNDLVKQYADTDLVSIFTTVGIDSSKIDVARQQLLKEVTLSQWLLESGRATSKLANECLNFAGLKWRDGMAGFAISDLIQVPSESVPVEFCKFAGIKEFIVGYWKFLTRLPYKGLEDHTNTPENFIGFLQRQGYAADISYVTKVLQLLPEAQQLLVTASGLVVPVTPQKLQILRVPEEVEVGQNFRVDGLASLSSVGKALSIEIDNKFPSQGVSIGQDGKWEFDFVFRGKGDRKLEVSVDRETVSAQIKAKLPIDDGGDPEAPNPPGAVKLELTGSVGLGGVNRKDDVLMVKQRLRDLGYTWSATGNSVDTGTVQAIRLFQSIIVGRNSSKGDGRIDLGGPTHQWLQAKNAPHWQVMPLKGTGFINFERQQTHDEHDFGTDWMAEVIEAAGRAYETNHRKGNTGIALLAINDISLPYGGDTPQHSGHETGLACDIRLPKTNGQSGGITVSSPNYDRAAMEAMIRALRKQGRVRAVFLNDTALILKGLCIQVPGHHNHAHFEVSPPTRE